MPVNMEEDDTLSFLKDNNSCGENMPETQPLFAWDNVAPNDASWCMICGKILKDWDKRCPNMFLTSMTFGSRVSYSLSFCEALMKSYKATEIPSKALCCKCCLQLEETIRIEDRLKEIRADISNNFKNTMQRLNSGEITNFWQKGSLDDWACNDGPNVLEKSDLGIKIVDTKSMAEESQVSDPSPFKIRIMDPTAINKSVPQAKAPSLTQSPMVLKISAQELLKPNSNCDDNSPTKQPLRLFQAAKVTNRAAILRNNMTRVCLKPPGQVLRANGTLEVMANTPPQFLPKTLVATPLTQIQKCQPSMLRGAVRQILPKGVLIRLPMSQTSAVHSITPSHENIEVVPDLNYFSDEPMEKNEVISNGATKRTYQQTTDSVTPKIEPVVPSSSPTNLDLEDQESNDRIAENPQRQKRKSQITVREMNDSMYVIGKAKGTRKVCWTKVESALPPPLPPPKANKFDKRLKRNVARRGRSRIKAVVPSRFSRTGEKLRRMDICTVLNSVTDDNDADETDEVECDAPMRRSAFKKASKRLQIIAKYDKSCKVLNEAESCAKELAIIKQKLLEEEEQSEEELEEPPNKIPKLKDFKIVLSDIMGGKKKIEEDDERDTSMSSQGSSAAKCSEDCTSFTSADESQNSEVFSQEAKSDVDSVCNQIEKVILESPPNNKNHKSQTTPQSTDMPPNKETSSLSDMFICDICKLDFIKLDELRNHIEQDHFAPTY